MPTTDCTGSPAYTDDELRTLLATVGGIPAYVMFTNLARGSDAGRFAALLQANPVEHWV